MRGDSAHSNSVGRSVYVTLADADPVELVRARASVDGQVERETAELFIKLVGNGCFVAPPHPAAGKGFARAGVHSQQQHAGQSGRARESVWRLWPLESETLRTDWTAGIIFKSEGERDQLATCSH